MKQCNNETQHINIVKNNNPREYHFFKKYLPVLKTVIISIRFFCSFIYSLH